MRSWMCGIVSGGLASSITTSTFGVRRILLDPDGGFPVHTHVTVEHVQGGSAESSSLLLDCNLLTWVGHKIIANALKRKREELLPFLEVLVVLLILVGGIVDSVQVWARVEAREVCGSERDWVRREGGFCDEMSSEPNVFVADGFDFPTVRHRFASDCDLTHDRDAFVVHVERLGRKVNVVQAARDAANGGTVFVSPVGAAPVVNVNVRLALPLNKRVAAVAGLVDDEFRINTD